MHVQPIDRSIDRLGFRLRRNVHKYTNYVYIIERKAVEATGVKILVVFSDILFSHIEYYIKRNDVNKCSIFFH